MTSKTASVEMSSRPRLEAVVLQALREVPERMNRARLARMLPFPQRQWVSVNVGYDRWYAQRLRAAGGNALYERSCAMER